MGWCPGQPGDSHSTALIEHFLRCPVTKEAALLHAQRMKARPEKMHDPRRCSEPVARRKWLLSRTRRRPAQGAGEENAPGDTWKEGWDAGQDLVVESR